MRLVVTDTTCLIALDKLGRLDILPALFDVHAPEAVAAEFGHRPPWLTVTSVDEVEVVALRSLRALDLGEAEAIVLAQTLPDARLLLDDARGRATAHALGFRVTGTGGVLVEAKAAGLVPLVRPLLDALRTVHDFRLGDPVYEALVRRAGES